MGNKLILSQVEKEKESYETTLQQLRERLSEADRSANLIAKQNARSVARLEKEVHFFFLLLDSITRSDILLPGLD